MDESTPLTFLLENLTQLIKYYADLSSGAANELKLLRHDLSLMRAFLQEAAKRHNREEQFKEFVRQIREVVYDAEDTIDSCLTHAALSKKKSFLRRHINNHRMSLAEEVRSLRDNKINPLYNDARKKFATTQVGDAAETSEVQSKEKLKTSPLPREDDVVGFKDQEEILMGYIREKRDELDVISIIGMPGLGKTTLAWKIYKSKEIEFAFQTRIWVYVSQDFTIRDVLLSIMKGYTNKDMTTLNDLDLYQSARDCLRLGNFFIVLDDVWTAEAWNDISKIFPKDSRSGKVLITSRHSEVGARANVARKPHNLRFFTDDESWELLRLEVFGKGNESPPELSPTGKYIAKQCGGLPLAVVVIGGILIDLKSSAQTIDEAKQAWSEVSGNVSEHVKTDKQQRISEIVTMSYNKLSDDLKDCFVYMGVFPEDHEIDSWTLGCLWIAEGFVQRSGEKSLEEIAEENLNELINRNLVMAGKRNPNGRVKTCRVHDVIRAFCLNKAGFDDLNVFTEIKLSKDGVFGPTISDIQKYRRISIHSNLPRFLNERHKGLKSRSFLCYYKETHLLDPKYNSFIPESCTLLRVLDSRSFKFNIFPARLIELIHLRYVTLSCDELEILPDSVTQLWNLQILIVDTKQRVLQVKAHVWELYQLRHLKTKASIVLVGQKDGRGGQNLQTLSRLSPENCTREVFGRASNLKRLGIRGKLENLVGSNSLRELVHVEKLKLVYDVEYGPASEKPLRALPEHSRFPPNLTHLTLLNTYLDWKHTSVLGTIVGLRVLKLKDHAFAGREWNTTSGGFRELRFLLVANNDLALWNTSRDHFPVLRCLVLRNCKKLSAIPSEIAEGLEVLDLDGVTPSALESAKKIETKKNEKIQGQVRGFSGSFKLIVAPAFS